MIPYDAAVDGGTKGALGSRLAWDEGGAWIVRQGPEALGDITRTASSGKDRASQAWTGST